MGKRKRLQEEINALENTKASLENSISEIKNINAKFIPSDVMENIVDRNFSKMYNNELNNFENVTKNYNSRKKKYRKVLLETFLPIFLATGITLTTIGGYAIYYRNDLDAFTKYHGNEEQYTITYIDNKNNTWSEPIQLVEDPDISFFINVKTPLENTDNMVKCCTATYKEDTFHYEDFVYLSNEEVMKKIDKASIYSESVIQDEKITEDITEIGVINKIISNYRTSDIYKPGLNEPGYKILSILAALFLGVGITSSGIIAYHKGLGYERKAAKEAKQDLKIQKKKMKIFKKKKIK